MVQKKIIEELIGKNNEEWFKKSFLKDYRIVEDEMTKQMNKIKENSKLSAEQKQKKINKVIKENTKILINLAKDYKKNTDFFKSMYKK